MISVCYLLSGTTVHVHTQEKPADCYQTEQKSHHWTIMMNELRAADIRSDFRGTKHRNDWLILAFWAIICWCVASWQKMICIPVQGFSVYESRSRWQQVKMMLPVCVQQQPVFTLNIVITWHGSVCLWLVCKCHCFHWTWVTVQRQRGRERRERMETAKREQTQTGESGQVTKVSNQSESFCLTHSHWWWLHITKQCVTLISNMDPALIIMIIRLYYCVIL